MGSSVSTEEHRLRCSSCFIPPIGASQSKEEQGTLDQPHSLSVFNSVYLWIIKGGGYRMYFTIKALSTHFTNSAWDWSLCINCLTPNSTILVQTHVCAQRKVQGTVGGIWAASENWHCNAGNMHCQRYYVHASAASNRETDCGPIA